MAKKSTTPIARAAGVSRADRLVIATNRFVACLNAADGTELWRTKLPNISSGVVSVLVREDDVFAGVQGQVFCLDLNTGAIVWTNKLPGMGYQSVILAMQAVSSAADVVAAAQAAIDEAAAASATTTVVVS